MKRGYNGVAIVSDKYGINRHTIRKGKKELLEEILPPAGKVRQHGGGREKNVNSQWIDFDIVVHHKFLYCGYSHGLQYFVDKYDIKTDTGKIKNPVNFSKLSGNKGNIEKLSFC